MKKLRMEIKEISETGTFEGILSPYGNVDGGGDVVDAGAYTKTIKERGATVPMLWQHKSDMPIGQLALEDSAVGLLVRGTLLMELPEAQKAHLLIKARIVKGLSIGFETVKEVVVGAVRHLKEIKLYEGSIVTFPMNEMAMITSVKAKQAKGDFNEELADIQTFDGRYQLLQALSSALSSIIWSGLDREEIIRLTALIIEQFTEAYNAFTPVYLDAMQILSSGSEAWSAGEVELKERLRNAGVTYKESRVRPGTKASGDPVNVKIFSFAYGKSMPADDAGHGGGFVFDARCLTNPGREAQYAAMTAKDDSVVEVLANDDAVQQYLTQAESMVDTALIAYKKWGFNSLMVSFGCIGGKQRSVYLADQLTKHLNGRSGVETKTVHLELDSVEVETAADDAELEYKAGAQFSAASKKSLNNFAEMATAIAQGITALTAEEAGSPTSEGKAAVRKAKTEPVDDHSAVKAFQALIDEIKKNLN